MPKVIIVPRAQRQIDAASDWWHEHRDKAPDAFDDEVEDALAQIAENPAIGRAAHNVQESGVRRIALSRVHYDLYYRVTPTGDIKVLAVWHIRRGSPPF